jgi:hypothetical protein
MSFNCTYLQNEVIIELNEALNTPAAALLSGGATSSYVSSYGSLDTITLFLNQGAAEVARTAWPISDTATYAWQSGVRAVPLEAFASSTSGVPWKVSDVFSFGASVVPDRVRRSVVQMYDPNWATTTGTPMNWYEEGEVAVGLYNIPSTSAMLTVSAWVLPPILVNGASTSFNWIPDDLTKLIVFYAAWRVADRNKIDPALNALAPDLQAKFTAGIQRLQAQLAARDAGLAQELGIQLPQGET